MALFKAKQLDATDNYDFNTVTLGQTIPTQAAQAASKQYVDNVAQGLDVKQSVRIGTTSNIDLSSAPATIDGTSLVSGDRVLVKDQTAGEENGIYIFNGTGSAMTRSVDADNNPAGEVTANLFTFIEEGVVNADSGWTLTTDNPIVLDTTALSFTQFSGAGQIIAGAALSKTGNTLNVNVDDSTIEVSSDALRVKDGGITNNKLSGNIDASKIGDGSVSTTEFQYINSLTSNAQTQLNSEASTRASADTTLQSNINAEAATRLANDNTEIADRIAADSLIRSDLASTSNGLGASLVGVEDSAGNFTSTNVEGVLAELFTGAGGASSAITDLQAAAGTATGTAGLDYSSNNYVTDATSLDTAISVLDAALFSEAGTRASADSTEATARAAADATEASARAAADTLIRSDLASTLTGKGASLVGLFDTANYFTSTTVEGALAEVGLQLSGAGNVDSRLDNIESVIATTTGLAGVDFTSNNAVTDGSSLQDAISALDAYFGTATTSDLDKLHDITSTAAQIDTAIADAHTRAHEVLAVSTNGQTAFTLTNAATSNGTVELSVNGQGQLNGVDFTVTGTSLTWGSSDFNLATTDIVTVVYDVAA